jgi:AraC-like DNA-binding protein
MSIHDQTMNERIESALNMLRSELVECIAQGDWEESQTEQATRAALACRPVAGEASRDRETACRGRVRRAMKLLARTELSERDIALEVGCSCQSNLTTLLRKYTGTTPAAFRRAACHSGHMVQPMGARALRRFPVRPQTAVPDPATHQQLDRLFIGSSTRTRSNCYD